MPAFCQFHECLSGAQGSAGMLKSWQSVTCLRTVAGEQRRRLLLPRRQRRPPALDAQLPLGLRVLHGLAALPVRRLLGCALLRAASRTPQVLSS